MHRSGGIRCQLVGEHRDKRYIGLWVALVIISGAVLLSQGCARSGEMTAGLQGLQTYIQDLEFPRTSGFNFQDVSWVSLSPAGDEVYVLQRGVPAVSVWSLGGYLLRSWSTQELGFPHSLSFQQLADGSTRVWITDMAPPLLAGKVYGHCLKQFSVNGDFLGSIGLCAVGSQGTGLSPVQFDKVTDVGFDSEGYLWVSDGDLNGLNNRVLQLDQSGTVQQLWSAPDNKPGSGEKEFNLPHAVDVDGCDRVWVADARNSRVQVIRTDGAFLQQLQCFDGDGVYGVRVQTSPDPGALQLFVASSPLSSPTSGTMRVFEVSSSCSDPLPVVNGCNPVMQWQVNLSGGSSAALLHTVDVSRGGGGIYIAPLGGDLPPQKWLRVYLPQENQ